MKGKFRKILVSILCLALLPFALAACGEKAELTFESAALKDGSVSKSYEASVATALGAEGITYALKTADSLPKGLSLAADGKITGTPTEQTSQKKFTVVASASGAMDKEAEFTLTILAEGQNSFVFEVEYTDVSKLQGGGISGGASGLNMLQKGKNASNGWYLGYTHKTGLTITFKINSDEKTTAKMGLRLGTELTVMQMSSESSLMIKVNDVKLDYDTFKIKENVSQTARDFSVYEIAPEFDLIAGENVITFTILDNEFLNGATGGPLFDYMSLITGAELTWNPIEDNIL